ncbi:prolyl-tRNA synthetase associated domain-containing protein [Zavarzinia compransoris]|uniref:prolyl-tRNA synthetase associated domain-containing protein n=1 Tax=Zavarzinia marina TaxID=2911065 RepID=UPI001F469354|nr:prolyl-tRNA synthetase associated domain-containing protein [Zavarzinia marina]MCF4167490.1 prolyl-tRNA synthetase associated domain-containing protein [Zavarzinia marina]
MFFSAPFRYDGAMALTDTELLAQLDALGIPHRTVAHEAAHTVEEARRHRGTLPGGHAKNLFLKDRKGGFWLVVAEEEVRVDITAIEKHLGAPRLSFASAEAMVALLGVEPGSVTPFALANESAADVRLVLDSGLAALDPLNFHPLRNDRTTAIGRDDFLRFLEAVGHAPVMVDVAAVAAARAAARAAREGGTARPEDGA